MRPTADGRDTRNARGRATVRSIEREAVRLAQEYGPAALTVDQICEAVGITQRSFFNHFDTKDDALLGWDVPRLSEQRVRDYLTDPQVGVLSGALELVELPAELTADRELLQARFRVLGAAPWLAARQAARMLPVAALVRDVIEEKLRSLAAPEVDAATIRAASETITAMAASLTLRPPLHPPMGTLPPGADVGTGPDELGPLPGFPLPDPTSAASGLDGLRWIWDRLI